MCRIYGCAGFMDVQDLWIKRIRNIKIWIISTLKNLKDERRIDN